MFLNKRLTSIEAKMCFIENNQRHLSIDLLKPTFLPFYSENINVSFYQFLIMWKPLYATHVNPT